MRDYISPHGVFHTPDGHMAKFPVIYDYIKQGWSQQVDTQKKFKAICGCE
jgi:hypothetical protein